MRHFEELSAAGQVRRLRRLAQSALEDYGLKNARLTPLQHWENTTFRVDAEADASGGVHEPGRFLLRVHSPGYQTPESIASELAWLRALHQETALAVPQPMATDCGAWVVVASGAGVPQPRACSLLRWVRGRFSRVGHASYYESLGETMARLHAHAASWRRPAGFVRRRWDWDGFFGAGAGLGAGDDVWSLLPRPHRPLFESVAAHAREVMEAQGEGPETWGLIHADLHANNVLMGSGQARPIDFDDCGYGHWAYDFAVVLGQQTVEENERGGAQREALLRGYARHRRVPHEQLAHLKSFVAARRVALTLWGVGRARDNPAMRAALPTRLERAVRDVKTLLPKI
jgi:Ser/Thr protein kinase RdoA (MazF antagonist)